MYTKAKSIADIKAIFSTDNLAVSYILLERERENIRFFSQKKNTFTYTLAINTVFWIIALIIQNTVFMILSNN